VAKSKASSTSALPIERELLEVLKSSLAETLQGPDLADQIQRIKGLLYDKQFLEVFEDESLLAAYGVRWVPSRALAFREIFDELDSVSRRITGYTPDKGKAKAINSADDGDDQEPQGMICIGGGAGSELVAIAALLSEARPSCVPLHVTLVDIGPYGPLVDRFTTGIRNTMASLMERRLRVDFAQTDVLSSDAEADSARETVDSILSTCSSPARPPVITLLFTITELFTQSKAKTILFLRRLTNSAPQGTLLLVVDSANEEASAVQVGSQGRAFSLAMVLDGLLCSDPGQQVKRGQVETAEGANSKLQKREWRCIEKTDSRWFRLHDGLQDLYPIKLENTRYWLRLYKRQ
jgi:25S rRNA (uracil2843-N3)-methyltransferase